MFSNAVLVQVNECQDIDINPPKFYPTFFADNISATSYAYQDNPAYLKFTAYGDIVSPVFSGTVTVYGRQYINGKCQDYYPYQHRYSLLSSGKDYNVDRYNTGNPIYATQWSGLLDANGHPVTFLAPGNCQFTFKVNIPLFGYNNSNKFVVQLSAVDQDNYPIFCYYMQIDNSRICRVDCTSLYCTDNECSKCKTTCHGGEQCNTQTGDCECFGNAQCDRDNGYSCNTKYKECRCGDVLDCNNAFPGNQCYPQIEEKTGQPYGFCGCAHVTCSSRVSDRCTNSTCVCGTEPRCTNNNQCLNGKCMCYDQKACTGSATCNDVFQKCEFMAGVNDVIANITVPIDFKAGNIEDPSTCICKDWGKDTDAGFEIGTAPNGKTISLVKNSKCT